MFSVVPLSEVRAHRLWRTDISVLVHPFVIIHLWFLLAVRLGGRLCILLCILCGRRRGVLLLLPGLCILPGILSGGTLLSVLALVRFRLAGYELHAAAFHIHLQGGFELPGIRQDDFFIGNGTSGTSSLISCSVNSVLPILDVIGTSFTGMASISLSIGRY